MDRVPSAEELVAQAGFVRRLARSLLGDEGDDLAQDALAAALERPPRVAVDPRAWLTGVVRNLARMRFRSEARREKHERATPIRPGAPGPAEIAARLELQRRLVDAVRRLPEPYRSTVILRYLDDLPTREVARRCDVPLETARTHVKRGLARLREELARRDGRWRAGLLVLAGVPPAATSAGAAAGSAAGAVGGAIVAKKALLVVPVLALLGILVVPGLIRDDARPPAGPARPPLGAAAAAEEEDTGDAEPAAAAEIAALTSTTTPTRTRRAPRPKARHLRGRLLGVDPRVGGDARLTVLALGPGGKPFGEIVRGQADLTGAFHLEITRLHVVGRVEIDRIEIRVEHPGYMPLVETRSLYDASDAALRVLLAGGIAGRVVDRSGNPIAGAEVSIHRGRPGLPLAAPVETVAAGGDGRFRVRSPTEGEHVVVATAPGRLPAVEAATVLVPADARIAPLVLRQGETITGKVTRKRMRGVPLLVRARRPDVSSSGSRGLAIHEGHVVQTIVTAPVDRQDRFELSGLTEGPWLLSVIDADENVHPDVTGDIETRVTAPAKNVRLRVQVATLTIYVPFRGGRSSTAIVEIEGKRGTVKRRVSDRSNENRTAIGVLPRAPYVITVVYGQGGGRASREVRAPGPGKHQTVVIKSEPRLSRSTLVVHVKQPEGTEVIERTLFGFYPAEDPDPDPQYVVPVEREGDRFVLRNPAAGEWRLVIRPERSRWTEEGGWTDGVAEIEVPEKGDRKAVVKVVPGGRVRVRIRGSDGRWLAPKATLRDGRGREVAVTFVHRGEGGGRCAIGKLAGPGTNEIVECLPPGRYALALEADGYGERVERFEVKPGESALVDVRLQRR
jgi:RNA polymerase sigma factor (sigma-70 family)